MTTSTIPPIRSTPTKDLQHLSDLEHVRERPSMYIGDTTARAASSGLRSRRQLDRRGDGRFCQDGLGHRSHRRQRDGRRRRPRHSRRNTSSSEELDREVSTLEGVMTVLKFGGKFEKGRLPDLRRSARRRRHGGQLSSRASGPKVEGQPRRLHLDQQEYERGVPTGAVLKGRATKKTGTKTTFKPTQDLQCRPSSTSTRCTSGSAGAGLSEQRRAHQVP